MIFDNVDIIMQSLESIGDCRDDEIAIFSRLMAHAGPELVNQFAAILKSTITKRGQDAILKLNASGPRALVSYMLIIDN